MFDFKAFFHEDAIYKERLSQQDISKIRKSPQNAFKVGDYHFAAANADQDSQLAGKAYIAIGNPWRGLKILNHHSTLERESLLFIAFAHWYLNEKEKSKNILNQLLLIEDDIAIKATEFLRLLKYKKIPISMSNFREKTINAFKASHDFDVRFIGFPEQDADIRLGEDHHIQEVYGKQHLEKSEFYFHFDLGTPVPLDLNHLPTIRRIAFTYDIDMHLFNDAPILRSFHHVITCCSQSSIETEALYGCSTWTLPLFGGLSATHPPIKRPDVPIERIKEVLFTGSIATPIYAEKPSRFFALSQADSRFKIRALDQTFTQSEYENMLYSSIASPVSMRLVDGLGTRSLHSLQAEQAALQFNSNVIPLYLDDLDLCIGINENTIDEALQTLFETYDQISQTKKQLISEQVNRISPNSPETENRWLKTISFKTIISDIPASNDFQVINRSLNWFNHHSFNNLKSVKNKLLCTANHQDVKIKSLFYDAFCYTLAPLAENLPLLHDTIDSLKRDLSTKQHLPFEMLKAILFWKERDKKKLFQTLSHIWENRSKYEDSKYDGLIYFDLQSSLFMRSDMTAESIVNDCIINKALLNQKIISKSSNYQTSPSKAILSGIGAFLSKTAYEEGRFEDALSIASDSVTLCPQNSNAHFRLGVILLDFWITNSDDYLLGKGIIHLNLGIGHYPWHLVEILPRLLAYPELDQKIFNGKSHEVYLKFSQRIRTDRKHVSNLAIDPKSVAYLRNKLGLGPHQTAFEEIEAALDVADLNISEDNFRILNVVKPLCNSLVENEEPMRPPLPPKSLVASLLLKLKL